MIRSNTSSKLRNLFWGNRVTNRFLTTHWVVGKWYASTLLMCQFPGVRIPPSQLKMEAHETGDSSGLENRGSARAWGFDSLRFR